MEKISLNKISPSYKPNFKGQNQNVALNNFQAPKTSGIYPVYTSVPYGINQTGYIKIEERKLPTGEKLNVYKLNNGHIISIVQKPEGCPIVRTSFDVGSMDEVQGKEGISHLIEHSVFHESNKYSDIKEAIKQIGGETNASTSFNKTSYYIKLSDNNRQTLDKAIDIQADMLFNPKFSKLEKEKKIVIKEAKEAETDDFKVLISQGVKNLFLPNNSGVKDVVAGNEQSISNITQEDMFRYHNYYYTPSNASTTIVSPYDPDEVIKSVSKKFLEAEKNTSYHQIERKAVKQPTAITRNDLISKNENSKKVYFGFQMQVNSPQDEINAKALCYLIGLRSGFDGSDIEMYGNNDYIAFLIEDTDEYSAFEKLKEVFHDLYLNPPDEKEIKKTKKYILNVLKDKYLTNEDIIGLSEEYLKWGYKYDVQKEAVNNLTANDILNALSKLDINKCTMQVQHPKTTTQEELNKALQDYKSYITPISIPRQVQRLDIENSMENYNIYPMSSSFLKSSVLPDNTRLAVINSKNDDCHISWELTNPNLSKFNPTARMMLDTIKTITSAEDKTIRNQKDIDVNCSFFDENTAVLQVSCKKENIEEAIKQLKKEMSLVFDEKDFEKAKQTMSSIFQSTINSSAYDTFMENNLDRAYTYDKDKLLKELDKLTINEVKAYYNELMQGSYSNVAVIAPYQENKGLINTIASEINIPNFSFKKADNDMLVKAYKPQTTSKTYIKETSQPQYSVLYSAKTNCNKEDEVKFELLNYILKERIFNSLREHYGFGYQAGSKSNYMGDMFLITPYIVTDHVDSETVQKIYSQFDVEIKKLMQEAISPEELKNAKNSLKMIYSDISESNIGLREFIMGNLEYPSGLYQTQRLFKIIDSITPDDISKTANYVFKDKPQYLVDTTKAGIDNNLEYFKTLSDSVIQ